MKARQKTLVDTKKSLQIAGVRDLLLNAPKKVFN